MSEAISIYDLSRPDAIEVMRRYVMPRHEWRLQKLPGVREVCIGVKRRGGKHIEGHGLCLKVLVYRKGVFIGDRPVPPVVYVSHPEYGTVSVETDIEHVGKIVANYSLEKSPELVAGSQGCTHCNNGSITGLVKDDTEKKYLVTALHVFNALKPGDAVTWSKDTIVGTGTFNGLSYWYEKRDPQTQVMGFMDIGLISVDGAGIYDSSSTPYPVGDSVMKWEECEEYGRVHICGKNGVVIGEFEGILKTGHNFPAFEDTDLPYWRMIKFLLEPGNLTKSGDSGAPIIAEDGTWVGMHLGIDTSGPFSLALCSGDIIEYLQGKLGELIYITT
jgi:hypothetical protein